MLVGYFKYGDISELARHQRETREHERMKTGCFERNFRS